MKRVITSFKSANKDVLREISTLYPKGVDDSDLINFPTINGGTIRALEIELGDSLYLVKMEDENYYRKYLAKEEEEEEDEAEETTDDTESKFDDEIEFEEDDTSSEDEDEEEMEEEADLDEDDDD